MKKVGKSKEKTIKNMTVFIQNKANLSEDKFGAKHFSKRIYEIFHPLAGRKNKPNQTQFKPNSKPITKRPKMSVNIYFKSKYEKISQQRREKTNPKQTQFKPKTNPIAEKVTMSVRNAITMNYEKFPRLPEYKNKPNQTQNKPNWSEAQILPVLSLSKEAKPALSFIEVSKEEQLKL